MANINLDFSDFFQPVNVAEIADGRSYAGTQFGSLALINRADRGWPEIEDCHFALIGICEDRLSSDNRGAADPPNEVRKFLYQLYQGEWQLKFADLGNISAGATPQDTDFAIKTVLGGLLRKNIIPVLIGGGHHLTYAQYLGYESVEQTVNLVAVDPRFDIGVGSEEYNNHSWLSKIILHQRNFLFIFSSVGYQTYFVEQSGLELMGKLNFDIHRLGVCREKISDIEP